MKKIIFVISFLLLLSLGVIFRLGVLLFLFPYSHKSTAITPTPVGGRYSMLSRRILQDSPNDLLLNFLPLRQDLQATVADYGTSFGFYFEYLPTGTSIGVNSNGEFEAGSLFKVPVVMAYYHKKERLGITDDKVVTIKQSEIDKGFGDLWKRGAGAKISLDEAARIALTDSDNTAIQVVAASMDGEDLDAVYKGLDIDLKTQGGTTVMTPRGYGSVLKALFFSAVLNKADSERILHLLSKTNFSDKLPAGIPQRIRVAHKIGVVTDRFYQDCGIVYVPQRPYLLCMVSASDEDEARRRMVDISRKIYTYVANVDSPVSPTK